MLTSLIAAAPAAAEWAAPVEISEAGTRNASSLDIDANPAGGGVAAWRYGTAGVATVVSPAGSGPLAPETYAGSYGSPTVGVGGNSVGALAFQLQPNTESSRRASPAAGIPSAPRRRSRDPPTKPAWSVRSWQ